ncbi:MAG: prephenate dehydrogenase [Lachnospiraceae bacterium]|nr:prephenate dehydrogenase [Lachnospiraceae bacterium]
MRNLTIGFIGLGLIGGSVARSLRKMYPEFTIMAYSRSASTTQMAMEENLIDKICEKNDPAFSECDYIFLCAPVQTNITYLPFLKEIIQPNCIITDVGSVKGLMHTAIREVGLSDNFIGGHPMAGSEKTGLESSTDYMFENAYYFITPEPGISKERIDEFTELVSATKALTLVMPPEKHDFIVAGISHLPHIMASCLVNTVKGLDTEDQDMKRVAAGGFKDITRIASSSPEMWQQICLTNPIQISSVLGTFIEKLQYAKSLVDAAASEELISMFSSSKNYRDSLLDLRTHNALSNFFYTDMRDESGGIATLTVLLAVKGISIRDIGIIHNREYEQGVLRIEFYNTVDMDAAKEILTKNNYVIYEPK